MSASESTEPKGKFFKAVVTSPHNDGKPKKSPQRTVPPLRPRRCLPLNQPSKLLQTAPGPTGEAPPSDTPQASEASVEMLQRLNRALDTSCGGTVKCQDQIRHLTQLLFSRNFTGFREKSENLEDIAIIETIFSANSKRNQHQNQDQGLDSSMTANSPLKDKIDQVVSKTSEPFGSVDSDPNRLSQSTSRANSPLLVRGQKRGVLRLGKSPAKGIILESKHVGKMTGWKAGERRTVGMQQVRLPKLVTKPKRFTPDVCTNKEDIVSERSYLKRSTDSAETVDEDSRSARISYPCPRNLTIIQRRGTQTMTRVCSPMPTPRKPLPPIRRRHHSDICTVCPEVHDWKGLARNPRWYPSKTGARCTSKAEKEHVAETLEKNSVDIQLRKDEVPVSEIGDCRGERDVQTEDLRDEANNETIGSKIEDWYPEKSIPDANDEPCSEEPMEPANTNIRDIRRAENNHGCNAVSNAHCPWLVESSAMDQRETHTDFDRFSARLLDDMDFECINKTEIEFEDDETFRQAVLLRNHILNHGSASNGVDESLPSTDGSQDQATINRGKQMRLTKRFEDFVVVFNAPVKECESQFQEKCDSIKSKSVNGLNGGNGSHILPVPQEEVTMSSRGQQKVVNSSLVAVGKGQSENQARSNDGVTQRKGPRAEITKDDSSETLLKREMSRYLHSLRHHNVREKRQHRMSSSQNLPVKVQNLSAVRPITADVSCSKVLTKAVGFIPILTPDEYASLCKKANGPAARIPRTQAAALSHIAGNPSEMLLVKRFNGEVEGKQLPWQRGRKNKK